MGLVVRAHRPKKISTGGQGGHQGVACGGCPLPTHLKRSCTFLHRKFFSFCSSNVAFWCILCGFINNMQLLHLRLMIPICNQSVISCNTKHFSSWEGNCPLPHADWAPIVEHSDLTTHCHGFVVVFVPRPGFADLWSLSILWCWFIFE